MHARTHTHKCGNMHYFNGATLVINSQQKLSTAATSSRAKQLTFLNSDHEHIKEHLLHMGETMHIFVTHGEKFTY